MTINFAGSDPKPTADYGDIKYPSTGDTFLCLDNDGEEWVVLVDENRSYVVLASSEDNHAPGTIYENWDQILETLEDYKCTVRQVDFTVRVDD